MAESASFSSTMKLKLIFEAPCETIRILISAILEKARRGTPGVYLRLFPTRQMRAMFVATLTSPRGLRSSMMVWSDDVLSKVNETDTSEVATISTGVWCRSKTSNSAFRNPYAMSIRDDETVTIVIPRFDAIDLIKFLHRRASRVIRVPVPCGLLELRMKTGMFCSTAGNTVNGWRTFAPKHASSEA